MTDDKVRLNLSRDEAIVLFEWLTRFNKLDDTSFADQAEQRVLWDMEAMLETTLHEPFRPDYEAHLAQARMAVRDSDAGGDDAHPALIP